MVSNQKLVKMTMMLLGSLTVKDEIVLSEELSKMAGVKTVELNLATNRLTVSFDMRKIKVEQIVYRVTQLGYQYIKRP